MKDFSVSEVKISVSGHKPIRGIVERIEEGAHFVLYNGEKVFKASDGEFVQEFTPEEWEDFKKTKAYITLLKDLKKKTEGISLEVIKMDDVELHVVTRLYPTLGGISLSRLVSAATYNGDEWEVPKDAIILKGSDEAAILRNILEQGAEKGTLDDRLEIEIIEIHEETIKPRNGGAPFRQRYTAWKFV